MKQGLILKMIQTLKYPDNIGTPRLEEIIDKINEIIDMLNEHEKISS